MNTDMVSKLADEFASELPFICNTAFSEMSSVTESPIEALLGTALWFSICTATLQSPSVSKEKFAVFCSQDEERKFEEVFYKIIPQYKWESYRIDFVIVSGGDEKVFVECDGHAFHERTPAQAERDRSKDRAIQQAGIPILRFTGREIYRSPFRCADQIVNFVLDRKR